MDAGASLRDAQGSVTQAVTQGWCDAGLVTCQLCCVCRQKPFAVGFGKNPKHMLKSKVRFFGKTFSDIVDLRLQGLRLCIMESKESCVFCNTEQSVKNMRRHITLYCDKARAECPGGDLLQEWERRTA